MNKDTKAHFLKKVFSSLKSELFILKEIKYI